MALANRGRCQLSWISQRADHVAAAADVRGAMTTKTPPRRRLLHTLTDLRRVLHKSIWLRLIPGRSYLFSMDIELSVKISKPTFSFCP